MKPFHLLLALVACMPVGIAHAESKVGICGSLKNGYGPFDYRRTSGDLANELETVESNHFNSEVEKGIRGMTSSVGGDLDYTLRAFPNHPRALLAMANIALREKVVALRGAHFPVECYFDRAIRFQPNDAVVRGLYANYLYTVGQTEPAIAMFKQAVAMAPDNPTINYNLGLALFKTKDFANANLHAVRAYALGFPLPGLKRMLTEAGKWDDKVDIGIVVKPKTEDAAPASDSAAPATDRPAEPSPKQ